MQRLRLVQLPVPPPAALASTGNVPLAAGSLAVSARVHGLASRLQVDVVPPPTTDALGDALLKKSQPQRAEVYFQRILQAFPGSRQAEAAQLRLQQLQGTAPRAQTAGPQ